jgi:hypothetical protein
VEIDLKTISIRGRSEAQLEEPFKLVVQPSIFQLELIISIIVAIAIFVAKHSVHVSCNVSETFFAISENYRIRLHYFPNFIPI